METLDWCRFDFVSFVYNMLKRFFFSITNIESLLICIRLIESNSLIGIKRVISIRRKD